ncbi:MAG: tetraacyldisaccharide 4'-kinase [Opitutae bacterium]|nr:tetraacyldisaccharide 4'-kinase [Opitutae bacterium]|tara:strand:+ start:3629 stop:4864 length:1236 start_codon:yes stop_codon:yes gene_type:complete
MRTGFLRRLGRSVTKRSERFEQFVVDVIYDRELSGRGRVLAGFLWMLSHVFASLVRLRMYLYRNRILRDQPLGCLVVVVGNLTVGGTGKTPVVERLARALTAEGRKVAILSRGYKSRKEPLHRRAWRWLTHVEAPDPKVVSDGEGVLLDSNEAGDEPYMLARNLPGVMVLVDKDRVKAGAYAIRSKFGADTLVLDDGFQYLRLKGALNLLLIDQTNPFGNECLLPRGILREPIRNISRASYVFLTKSDKPPDLDLVDLIKRHNSEAKLIRCTHKPCFFMEVNGDEKRELDYFKGLPTAVFCGIAMPGGFERFIADQGADVRYRRRFLDHHRYTIGELKRLIDRANANGAEMIVTTEKDAVRIPKSFKPSLPLFYMRMEIEILEGFDDFESAVQRICLRPQENFLGAESEAV